MVDYSSLENCRAERHRGFESLSLRFRYSEMNIREKSKKIVSIIATSSYDTFLLYPSQISEYARRGQKRVSPKTQLQALSSQAHNFISLYKKKGISVTPLNCALNALTFALKDSALAFVALLTKKLSMVS